ncbi:MAG: FAD-binding oxidoreductase [Betaproteobacteria bacterium]|nr:FAD-binding oxidoreductase [Betaproteobacteria bacterium]
MKKETKILVIGAGISGLTTAISLKEKGFHVVIVAENFSPDLVSNVAGALWEWPPAACGKHGNPRSLKRSKAWCMVSYEKFKVLQAEYGSELTGIYLRNATFYFHKTLEELPEDLNKMNELAEKVDNFRRGLDIVPNTIDLTSQQGIKDAYQLMAPMVDTDVYMQWLLAKVKKMGCEIIQERIALNLIEHEQTLLDRFQCAAIVNCSGLGSIEIANDPSMYPLKGALVKVKDEKGLVDGAHCISHKETSNSEQNIVFIVPRGNKKTVILGGLVQIHQWGQSMSMNDPIIKRMYKGCLDFLPLLKSLPLDEKDSVRTGLRPFTRTNVCVEHVPTTNIFYNYGHGGAGVTLSWGCAQETAARIQAMLHHQVQPVTHTLTNKLIDRKKQTVFLLQNNTPIKSELAFINTLNCNLVLLCSPKGLEQIIPSHFEHLSHVQILAHYDLPHLLEVFKQIKNSFVLDVEKCHVITIDDDCILLAAEMREALGLTGDKTQHTLPIINKLNNANKPKPADRTKGSLFNISVVIINGKLAYFAPCQYSRARDEISSGKPISYLITRTKDPEYPILFEFIKKTLAVHTAGHPFNGVMNFDIVLHTDSAKTIPPTQPALQKISAHAPIDLISRLFVPYQGLTLNEWQIKLQMDYLQKPTVKVQENQKYSALCIYPKKAGKVTEIKTPLFNSPTEIYWRIHPGQELTSSKNIEDYALAVLLSNNHWEVLKQDIDTAGSHSYFDVT